MDWIRGDLSTQGRILGAIWPALLFLAYLVASLTVYLTTVANKGRHRDAEVESRGSSALLGMNVRLYFAWLMRPVWGTFKRLDIPPNAVTTLSVFISGASGVCVSVGRFSLGGWLYLLAGMCDFIDGRLARESGKSSKAGAALDSILDRYSESFVLIGLGWYYRESWVLLAVMLVIMGSFLVSYIRARGEGLGVDVKVGLMQRPERLVLLGVSLVFSPVFDALYVPTESPAFHRLTVFALVLMAAGTQFTALRRLTHVLALLDERTKAVWQRTTGKGSLVRSVVAAAVATGVDFSAVVMLVTGLGLDPSLATGLGCVAGGFVNFTINRLWTFGATGPAVGQAWRYVFVSASSAGLNSAGVAVLLFVPAMDYRLAWALVRGAVFVLWNYPLQRDYVFGEIAPKPMLEDSDPHPSAS